MWVGGILQSQLLKVRIPGPQRKLQQPEQPEIRGIIRRDDREELRARVEVDRTGGGVWVEYTPSGSWKGPEPERLKDRNPDVGIGGIEFEDMIGVSKCQKE